MRKEFFLISAAVLAFATPAMAKDKSTKLGNGDYSYLIFPQDKVEAVIYPDDPSRRTPAEPVTTKDFDVSYVLDKECRIQAPKQAPSMLKDIGIYTLRTAPFTLAGGYVGSIAGGLAFKGSPIRNKDYGLNAGVQGLFGAIGAGLNASEMAKHYDIAGCMVAFTQRAQDGGYLNKNIMITYNAHPARGHPVRREDFATPTDGSTPAAQPSTDAAPAQPVKHHVLRVPGV